MSVLHFKQTVNIRLLVYTAVFRYVTEFDSILLNLSVLLYFAVLHYSYYPDQHCFDY